MVTGCYSHSTNMKCHNLCITIQPLHNMAKLLGLGTTFCIQSKSLNYKNFTSMIERFKQDVRVRHCANNTLGDQQQDLPKHCITIFHSRMPKAPKPIEGTLKRF